MIYYKKLLIDAIKPPRDTYLCDKLTKEGYMQFTGNQYNLAWTWFRSELEKFDKEALERIYLGDVEWLIN